MCNDLKCWFEHPLPYIRYTWRKGGRKEGSNPLPFVNVVGVWVTACRRPTCRSAHVAVFCWSLLAEAKGTHLSHGWWACKHYIYITSQINASCVSYCLQEHEIDAVMCIYMQQSGPWNVQVISQQSVVIWGDGWMDVHWVCVYVYGTC